MTETGVISRRRKSGHLRVGVAGALLWLVAACIVFPLYWLVVASTKTTRSLFATSAFVPSGSLFHNAQNLFTYQGGTYERWLLNTAIYAFVGAGLGTYISTLCGYALAMFRFRGRGVLLATTIGSLMVPGTTLVIPIFILERVLHLTDTYEGVMVPLMVFPFGVFFISLYAQDALPSALLDAGRVDGASEALLVRKVALPVLRPGMVTMFLIAFIGCWNNYFLPLVLLSNRSLLPVTVGLGDWLGNLSNPSAGAPLYSLVIMGSLVSILPMIVLFPFLQKYVTRGLTMGSLVGG